MVNTLPVLVIGYKDDVLIADPLSGNYFVTSSPLHKVQAWLESEDSPAFMKEIKDTILKEREENTGYSKPYKREHFKVLIIIPTLNCNFRCKYCYASGGEVKTSLNTETLFKGIDAFFQRSEKESLMTFHGGGEPLLRFDLIEKAIKYVEENYSSFSMQYFIATNGSILTEDILNTFIDHAFNVTVTLDGPEEIQNVHRPDSRGRGTYHTVRDTVLTLVNNNVPVGGVVVVSDKNVEMLAEITEHHYDLGMTRIVFSPLSLEGKGRTCGLSRPDPDTFSAAFMRAYDFARSHDMKISTLGVHPEEVYRQFDPSPRNFCDMDVKMYLNPGGVISGCNEINTCTGSKTDIFVYGQVGDDVFIDEGKVAAFKTRVYTSMDPCRACPLAPLCKGGCPLWSVDEHNTMGAPSVYSCEIAQKVLPKVIAYEYLDSITEYSHLRLSAAAIQGRKHVR